MLTTYNHLTDRLHPDSHLRYRNPLAGEEPTHLYHAGENRYYDILGWAVPLAAHPVVKRSLKEMFDDPAVHKEYASKGNWHLYDGDGKRRIYLGTHYVG